MLEIEIKIASVYVFFTCAHMKAFISGIRQCGPGLMIKEQSIKKLFLVWGEFAERPKSTERSDSRTKWSMAELIKDQLLEDEMVKDKMRENEASRYEP